MTDKFKRLDWVAAAVALLCLAFVLWKNRNFFHDDAYISLRYARNLALHGALEWNLGERVEGYTNFLHTIVVAALLRLGALPELAARSLNAVAALSMIPAVVFATRKMAPQAPYARFLTIVAVGASPGVGIWILGGLEAVMVASLIAWATLGLIVTVQSGRTAPALGTALAFSLAVLTRMDSAVFIAGAGLSALLLANAPPARRLILAALISALPASVAFLHMGFRLQYYGLPFPLTFYAKSGMPLATRLSFIPDLPLYTLYGIPLLFLAAAAALSMLTDRGQRLGATVAIPLGLQITYICWSGGDHMAGGRVFVPLVAPAALLLLTSPRMAHYLAGAGATLTLAMALLPPPIMQDPAAFAGTLIGRHLATWPDGQLISLATAGSTPFYADNHVYIDQLGLNDPVIARRNPVPILTRAQKTPGHGKGDGAYILSREPDVIIIGTAVGSSIDEPVFLSDAEMAKAPEFAQCYSLQSAKLSITDEDRKLITDAPAALAFTWYKRTCPKSRR